MNIVWKDNTTWDTNLAPELLGLSIYTNPLSSAVGGGATSIWDSNFSIITLPSIIDSFGNITQTIGPAVPSLQASAIRPVGSDFAGLFYANGAGYVAATSTFLGTTWNYTSNFVQGSSFPAFLLADVPVGHPDCVFFSEEFDSLGTRRTRIFKHIYDPVAGTFTTSDPLGTALPNVDLFAASNTRGLSFSGYCAVGGNTIYAARNLATGATVLGMVNALGVGSIAPVTGGLPVLPPYMGTIQNSAPVALAGHPAGFFAVGGAQVPSDVWVIAPDAASYQTVSLVGAGWTYRNWTSNTVRSVMQAFGVAVITYGDGQVFYSQDLLTWTKISSVLLPTTGDYVAIPTPHGIYIAGTMGVDGGRAPNGKVFAYLSAAPAAPIVWTNYRGVLEY